MKFGLGPGHRAGAEAMVESRGAKRRKTAPGAQDDGDGENSTLQGWLHEREAISVSVGCAGRGPTGMTGTWARPSFFSSPRPATSHKGPPETKNERKGGGGSALRAKWMRYFGASLASLRGNTYFVDR